MKTHSFFSLMTALAAVAALPGCGSRGHGAWDSPDYSRVYQRVKDNDSGYIAPSVINCVDDDLYNC